MDSKLQTNAATVEHLESKMVSLQRAYKTASNAEKQTGAAPSNFMYMEQMEEIFGTRPIAASKHTLNLFGKPITANVKKPAPLEKSLPFTEFDDETATSLFDNSACNLNYVPNSANQVFSAPVSSHIKHTRLSSDCEYVLNNQIEQAQTTCTKKTNLKGNKNASLLSKTKPTKDELLKKKIDWEREKFEKKQIFQLKMMELNDAKKQKRHEEKKELMLKHLKENKQ